MGTTLSRGIPWGPHCPGVHSLGFKTQRCAWRSTTPSLSEEDWDGWLCPHQQQPEQEKSEPAPGHQNRLLTTHQEQEMSEALLCHHCSFTCHTHTCPQAWRVSRLFSDLCRAHWGEEDADWTSSSSLPPPLPLWVPEQLLGKPYPVNNTFPSLREGKGGKKKAKLVGKQEQRVNIKDKQSPRQSVDCHSKGKEWALSALYADSEISLTTDI